MNKRILRQYYTGRNIGAFLDTYQRSAGIISAIQFLAMFIILYTTSARPFLDIYFPWVTFWMYMTVAVVVAVVIMISVYVIAAPSSFAFHNQQLWKHNNPMRHKLEAMEKTQAKLGKQLDRIERTLEEMQGK